MTSVSPAGGTCGAAGCCAACCSDFRTCCCSDFCCAACWSEGAAAVATVSGVLRLLTVACACLPLRAVVRVPAADLGAWLVRAPRVRLAGGCAGSGDGSVRVSAALLAPASLSFRLLLLVSIYAACRWHGRMLTVMGVLYHAATLKPQPNVSLPHYCGMEGRLTGIQLSTVCHNAQGSGFVSQPVMSVFQTGVLVVFM